MLQTDKEYAEALFAIALEENAVDEYISSVKTIKQLILENPDYTGFLASPAIPFSERVNAIEEAFGNDMPEYIITFLKILCENGKIRTLLGCIDEFLKLAFVHSNMTTAQIYSAVNLNENQKKKLIKNLEKITNKTINPVYIIDPSLIGGMKVEVDGQTFDGSIKHRLSEIKDVMNS